MATIPEITDRLEAATEKAENASQIIYDVANGDASTEVPTASGPTPALKKWFQDLGSEVEPMLAGIPARLDKAVLVYQTKAEADAAAATLPDGQKLEVEVDETHDARRTRYVVQGGELVYVGLASDAASISFISAGVGAVPRVVQDKLREFVSVKDFGAVGDGATDDTAAIQAAINYAAAIGGAVLLSGSSCLCNGQLLLQTNTVIFGPGKLVAGPINGFPVDAHLGFLYAVEKNNIQLRDFEVDISAWTILPSGVSSVRAVLFRRGVGFEIEGCRFVTTGGGPAFIGCKDIIVDRNELVCTPVAGVTNGYADGVIDVWVEFDIDAERCIISNNRIKGNDFGRWGVMVTGLTFEAQVMEAKSFCVNNNIIEGMFFDGVWAFGRNALLGGISIIGNVIRNVRKGISISDATGFSIVGNSISDTDDSGIHLWTETSAGGTFGATGGTVASNILRNVASGAGTPVALWIDGTSSRNAITGNTVVGTTHHFGLTVGSSALRNIVSDNNIQIGRGPRFFYQNAQTRYVGANYSATVTGLSNVSSSSFQVAQAHIVGEAVFVFFRLSVTPTTAGQFTRLAISLPYQSDITTWSLFGGASQETGESAFVTDDPTDDRAFLDFTPASNAARNISGWFSYRIAEAP